MKRLIGMWRLPVAGALVASLASIAPAGAATPAPEDAARAWRVACADPCPGPSGRYYATMAYDASIEAVVLFGGVFFGEGGPFLNDTWLWSGAGWEKVLPPTLPPKSYPVMAYDAATGTIVLVTGGQTWLWTGSTRTWTKQSPALQPPQRNPGNGGMAYDPVSRTVLLYDPVGRDAWTWDGATRQWTLHNPSVRPPQERDEAFPLAYDPATRKVVLFGSGGTWLWDGATKNWSQANPAVSPEPRIAPAMATDEELGAPVMFGGMRYRGVPPVDPLAVHVADTWVWDGTLTTWVPYPAAGPTPRFAASMAYDAARGRTVLFGGEGLVPEDPACGAFCWNFPDETWTFGPVAPDLDPGSDTTPPETSITAGPSGAVTPTGATFEFASSEEGSTFACSLDGSEPVQCTSPRSYTGLAQGSHTFQVAATDAAGNTDPSPAVRTWSVDSVAPAATTLLAPANGTTTNVARDFDWSDVGDPSGVSYHLQVDNGGSGFGSPEIDRPGMGASSYSVPFVLPDGTYSWRVKTTDGGGNAGPWSSVFSFTLDAAAPSAPGNLTATALKGKKISLTWTASSDGSGSGIAQYEIYRATSSSGPFARIAGTTQTTYTNSGLTQNTTYWYYVRAIDRAGNVSADSTTASARAR